MRSLARLGLCAGVLAVVGIISPRGVHAVCSSAGVVSNVNDCVPAGKSSLDCHAEWSITPQPPSGGGGIPLNKVFCMDNDPTCDADTTPGQCTFLVGACVNVVDPRLTCSPTDTASYDLARPSVENTTQSHKDSNARDNRRRLTLDLDALIPTASPNVCTPQERFVVALKKGVKKRIAGVALRVTDSGTATDADSMKLICLPNPAIATIPCASARKITSASELIGGPLAMGKIDDYLLENDKARFIVSDTGREFSFMLTYGGHLIDADLQQKFGSGTLSPPYPPGRDNFHAITPLINISSSDNPTSITILNDGASGGPAKLRTLGPDDLFDPIDPRVAIKGFSASLSVPAAAIDNNIPVMVSSDYTLNCGDNFLTMETTVQNTGGTDLDLYVGDYANGGGQTESVGPGLGFSDSPIRVGDANLNASSTYHYDYFGWFGFGAADFLAYALIPEINTRTSSFAQSGVVVPVYGNSLLDILLPQEANKQIGALHVTAGGSSTFKRWLAVSNNGMGRVLDARTRLAARGELPLVKTGWVQGTVTVAGTPVDGARVVISKKPGDRGSPVSLVDAFETRDGGFFQGTIPVGSYVAAVKVQGHLYEGGGALPIQKPIVVKIGTTVVDFDVPATGFVRVTAKDGITLQPIASKISIVGLEATADPGTHEIVATKVNPGNVFGYDAREKPITFGLPYGLVQVHFTDLGGDSGVFALQPGTYQIVVSHGPRYSVFKQMLTVMAGSEASPQVVAASVVPVVDTTGFISGDFHVHMIESPDSVVSNRERIVTMLAEGVDFFVASDHDFITDLSADVVALAATNAVKAGLSQEITYFDSGHFGAYPYDPANLPDPNSHTGGALDWGNPVVEVGKGYPSNSSYDLSPNDMALMAKGPPYYAIVVQANHINSTTLGYFRIHGIDTTAAPPQSSVAPAQVRLDPSITNTYTDELTALEIWIENSRSQTALALGENLGDWFNMLNNWSSAPGHDRLRKTATFDSDTHTTTVVQAGGPRNMVADNAPSISAIDPVTVATHINEGRDIGTNGPFVQVSIVGDAGATAAHALGSPLLVPAALGIATIHVDIKSPDWAEFDQVQIFVNNTPSCTTTAPNFVNSVKQVCPPVADFTLNKGADFVVNTVPVNGSNRLEASIVKVLTGGSLPAVDAWVVVVVKGTDGVSKPLFPMAPTSIQQKACTLDPCRPCNIPQDCAPFSGVCANANLTATDLADGNLGQCGVTSLAIANPLFIDRNGDGVYNGLTIP
ncbi:MAG: hypothetical protein HY271_10435 [Deltaproteobacteria bacterium]|nr:hypothetical protein [Deltaproteobacteria bacterium]